MGHLNEKLKAHFFIVIPALCFYLFFFVIPAKAGIQSRFPCGPGPPPARG
jgi:hypothetical protein